VSLLLLKEISVPPVITPNYTHTPKGGKLVPTRDKSSVRLFGKECVEVSKECVMCDDVCVCDSKGCVKTHTHVCGTR